MKLQHVSDDSFVLKLELACRLGVGQIIVRELQDVPDGLLVSKLKLACRLGVVHILSGNYKMPQAVCLLQNLNWCVA